MAGNLTHRPQLNRVELVLLRWSMRGQSPSGCAARAEAYQTCRSGRAMRV